MTLTVAILIGALVGGIVGGGSYFFFKRIYQKEFQKTSGQPSSSSDEIQKSKVSESPPPPKPKPPPQENPSAVLEPKPQLTKETPTPHKDKAPPDPTKARPPDRGFREKPPDKVTFSLGGGGMHTTVSLENLRKSDATPFQLGGFVPVRIYIKDDVPYCDVTLWGGQGKPPVEVKENEFSVTPPGWDRNFTANALEVVDEKGVPIFQMIRKSQTHYVANGYFVFPGGIIVATDKGTSMRSNPNRGDVPVGALSPIFKYPSWKYPGKYADNSN